MAAITVFLITAFLLMIHTPQADHRQGAICTNHNAFVAPLIYSVFMTDSIWHVHSDDDFIFMTVNWNLFGVGGERD